LVAHQIIINIPSTQHHTNMTANVNGNIANNDNMCSGLRPLAGL
jgi:hypothetical protein